MTKAEMEKMNSLRKECIKIIAEMEKPRSSKVVVFYKDYKYGYGAPKAKQEIDEGEEHLRILRGSLRAYQRQLRSYLTEAEKFLESIEDSEIRTILWMYYINGNTLREIADALGYTEARICQKRNTFWFDQERNNHVKL